MSSAPPPASPTFAGAPLGEIAGRFRLEGLVGAGGMGHVYRATDLRRGVPVAIKLMRGGVAIAEAQRFAREASVLAQLDHPNIVSYVGHGLTDGGEPYLAMEWLDGEDLGQRLQRAPLTAVESVQLVRRVAQALGAAHSKGVVHRDLKPGNLFLRGGEVERVTLVDFGIARQGGVQPTLTQTGMLVGTPEYMAPEQARGERELGPGTDFFALGCVLFECLTGRPPFSAEHVTAVLLRILLEPPPRLRQRRPELPVELEELVEDMLAKDPEARVRSAEELASRLDALPRLTATVPVEAASAAGLGEAEQQLVSILIASPAAGLAGLAGPDLAPTAAAEAPTVAGSVPLLESLAALRAELEARGARTELTADGALTATLAQERMSAVDQAEIALGMARLVRERWPESVVALATGRGVVGDRRPFGEAVTRAGELLSRVAQAGAAPASRIFLEDVTAGLVGARVQTLALASGVSTVGDEPGVADASRPLLGKPTPCVGRESELGALEGALRSVCDDGEARALLVTGPPGIGKSRLLHEFLRRTAQLDDGVRVLSARAEAGQSGNAHVVARALLWRLFRLAEVDAGEARRERLRGNVSGLLPAEQAGWVSEFLGELCGVPFPDDESVKLRAARQDPRILRDQITHAWLAWLRAECTARPVLLILEDLHWGDRPSVALLDASLRDLEALPLMMVAFARPEITERTPDLWKGRRQDLPLKPLGRRAAEQLVRQVLGDGPPERTARIVAQAAGNALYLEELIRAAAEGQTGGMPPTVLAMLQARIGRLDAGSRRALRAASVFGESFPPAGVDALLGASATSDGGGGWLASLLKHEVIEAPREAADGQPFRFRHALMRDAAYSLLTDEDRVLGHRLAAAFLQSRVDDPVQVATHLVLGERKEQAVRWFLQAAERARGRDEHAMVGELTAQALDCDPQGEELGVSLVLHAESLTWRWDFQRALPALERALPLLERGSRWWCYGMQSVATSLAYSGVAGQHLVAACNEFLATDPASGATLDYAAAAAHIASGCIQVGQTALGAAMLARADAIVGATDAPFPSMRAWRLLMRCTLARHTDDDLAAQKQYATEALRLYREAGASAVMVGLARDVLGELLCRLGEGQEGLALLRDTVATAIRLDSGYLLIHGRLALANSLIVGGAFAEAESFARLLLETPGLSKGFRAMARLVVAQARLAAGDLGAAEAEARDAIDLSPHTPIRRLQMVAALIRILNRAGRAAEACAAAEAALAGMADLGGGGYAELPLLAAAEEAFRLAGDDLRAARWRSLAGDKLARDARKFPDPAARQRFLSGVPLHAEILSMTGPPPHQEDPPC